MKKFLLITLSFFLVNSISINAKTVSLMKITNDDNTSEYYTFDVKIDPHNFEIIKFYKKHYETRSDRTAKTTTYKLDRIQEGYVLEKRMGSSIVTISSNDFNPLYGGVVKMTYLYSYFDDHYKNYYLDIVLEDGKWAIYTRRNRKQVHSMFLESHKGFFGKKGIKKVHVNKDSRE